MLNDDDLPPWLRRHYPASTLLRGSPPLTGASVLSASRLEPLAPCMGLFLSRSFGTPAHLLSFISFFVRSAALMQEQGMTTDEEALMPAFSRSFEQSLHRALALANERHHEYATLEHLLLALIDDVDALAAMK